MSYADMTISVLLLSARDVAHRCWVALRAVLRWIYRAVLVGSILFGVQQAVTTSFPSIVTPAVVPAPPGAFEKLRHGMSEEQVLSLVGKPSFRVSWSQDSGNFRRLEWERGDHLVVVVLKDDGSELFAVSAIDTEEYE